MELLSIIPILGKTTQSIQFSFNSFFLKPHALNIEWNFAELDSAAQAVLSPFARSCSQSLPSGMHLQHTPLLGGGGNCTCARVEFGSQFFWPFAVTSEPGFIDVAKGVTREYPRAELGSPRLDVSAICGSETDFTSVLALASSATGKSPSVMRELYKHSKCQILLFSLLVWIRRHWVHPFLLFPCMKVLNLSPASLVFAATLTSTPCWAQSTALLFC